MTNFAVVIIRYTILLFALLCLSFKHPFYLGVTELKYSEKEKSVQVTVKLFTNDLEDALAQLNKKKPDLINGTDKKELNKLVSGYVLNRLAVKINGKASQLNYLGFEHENDAVWIYLESVSCPRPFKIDVTNRLLYDLLKSQTHIVHCEVKGEKKSYKLSYPDSLAAFSF